MKKSNLQDSSCINTNKKINFLIVMLCSFCLLFSGKSSAQRRLSYVRDIPGYVQDMATTAFNEATMVLEAYPPTVNPGIERKLALTTLDVLFHDTRIDKGTAFMSHVKRVIGNVATELSKNKPTGRDLRIYRSYNLGYIIQTASVTIAFDLVRGGSEDFQYISDTLMRSIVDRCDILFITHSHDDHADVSVAKMFSDQGKKVIVPEELWNDMPQLKVLRGTATNTVREDIRIPHKNVTLTVRSYPGYQMPGDTPNNIYMVTVPEGRTIMHTGDQFGQYEPLFEEVNRNNMKVDILMTACASNMKSLSTGVKPSLMLTGHENETEHPVDHRGSFWLSFHAMHDVQVPFIIMAWGETYLFKE